MIRARDRSAERDGYVGTTLLKRITITRIAFGDGVGPWSGKLTQNEKDGFYAMQLVIAANGGVARSEDIKNHELTRNITQPTFHRSLKSLVSQGLPSHAPNTKAGSYISPEGVRAPMPAELSAIV